MRLVGGTTAKMTMMTKRGKKGSKSSKGSKSIKKLFTLKNLRSRSTYLVINGSPAELAANFDDVTEFLVYLNKKYETVRTGNNEDKKVNYDQILLALAEKLRSVSIHNLNIVTNPKLWNDKIAQNNPSRYITLFTNFIRREKIAIKFLEISKDERIHIEGSKQSKKYKDYSFFIYDVNKGVTDTIVKHYNQKLKEKHNANNENNAKNDIGDIGDLANIMGHMNLRGNNVNVVGELFGRMGL